MVGNSENILVEFDYQNIVLVDPNKTIDNQGVVRERLLKHEDLVYYANLECNLFPRTRLSVGTNGYYENKTISIAAVNFLKPGGKTFLDNGYLDEITGLNSTLGGGTNQIIESKTTVTKSDKSTESYISQSVKNGTDNNLLLISQITIDTPLNLVPTVTIEMEDIRGRALFEQGENSPYAVFFNYPYPLFYLTVKGYLGKAVKYQLALKTFNARFDTQSGNFKIQCVFMAFKYNVLTNINMEQIQAVPYMYQTKYQKSPSANSGTQSAQNQIGNTNGNITSIPTSRGYEKVKEVYSEYKSKGLIPDDFPELTLTELINRLETLEKNITSTFQKADMTPITDGENFRRLLTEFEQEIFLYKTESWFAKYLDKDTFLISEQGQKFYTFKKDVVINGNKEIAKKELTKIIADYTQKLEENPTFGNPGQYTIEGKTTSSKINIKVTEQILKYDALGGGVNWDETYSQRTGKEPNKTAVEDWKLKNAVSLDGGLNNGQQTEWYRFEGSGSFVEIIENAQNDLTKKMDEIQGKLTDVLSKNLSDPKSGLGFKPTLKNVIAVVLASSEAFLRLMCDVHQTAWDQRKNKYRVGAVLSNDKAATSTDAKQSVQTTDGNLIPVYPWPQYFIETNNPKGEKFEIAYPGDHRVVSKTKGYLYDVWPEVQFVEEFIKGKSLIITYSGDTGTTTNPAQYVNRVSLNSVDFPTTNGIFGNRQEVKFLFEIYERIFLSANYQRFMRTGSQNEILDILGESEFINIKNSLGEDAPFLIQKLKQYGFNSTNFVNFLYHFTSNGVTESWQKYIRDEFVTNYIQQEVDNSFAILDSVYLDDTFGKVSPEPKNLDKFRNYIKSNQTNETNFLDTFPYVINGWGYNNMANGSTVADVKSLYNTSGTYFLQEGKKMVSNYSNSTTNNEIRPITNFSFQSPISASTIGYVGLKAFYDDRASETKLSNQQVTEGTVDYFNYSGNVTATQTTSMLNTPYFTNSIISGVDRWLSGDTSPFVSGAYLLLNSLPIATLREKYKTYSSTTKTATDLDYVFASLKKFGAIHKMPYAWVLKQGSIWHRYKKWVEDGVDILDGVWKDFDYLKNFDPIGNNPNRTYTLTLPGQTGTTDIVLQTTTPVTTGTVSQMNVGFYPKLIDKFNLFYRGYNLFNTGYTNSDIQQQLNNTVSGFSLTQVADSSFNTLSGYNPSDITDVLSFKTWNCTLLDKKNQKEFLVPSFGSTINQTKLECFDNNNKLIVPLKSNPSVYNGSVRAFWSLPNYGYFDSSNVEIPTPYEYMKIMYSGQSQQEAFSLRGVSAYTQTNHGYTSIEEMFSVFNKDILDMMENEFLKFSKSMYEYETQQVGELITTRVQVDKLYLDTNGEFKNFQLLMKDLMSFEITTPSSINSKNQTTTIQTKHFDKFNNVIKKFLEYNVVLKYGNPGNYDRRLFDSYATNVFIEDKVSYNYYTPNSLPSSTNITTPLSVYKATNPESWKALETYVGFSNESGLMYTSTGSCITDFFIDMNIEFIPESVKELAPLVRIYATQKKLDPTMNRGKFINLLNSYIASNKKFSDELLNNVMQKVRFGLPNITELDEKSISSNLQGTQTKVELWETFKGLNDTWIAGYDYTQTTFLEDVLLLDRANRNMSDDVLIDPFKVRNLFSNINPTASVYFYLESLLDIHHFVCMMHPAYINYYNVQEVSKNSIPKIEGSLEFGNNLFGTFLNVDTRSSSPKLVCTYAAEPSKHLNTDKNENNKFKSDSFDLRRSSDNPLTDKLEDKTDYALSNRVVGFNVDIGTRNQNVFYYFDVSQDSGKQTSESLLQMDNLINQSNGKQVATQNVSLWNFYKSRSYQCKVNCLGNAMIQPTMYFNLRHVPMFNGPYYILDVKHTITPGRFETNFTGIRQQVFALPRLESYIQTLTKQIFLDLYTKLTQKVNTNPKDNPTANSNPNNSSTINENTTTPTIVENGVVTNTGSVDNGQNCSTELDSKFSKFVNTQQNQTSLSPQQVVSGITTNILANASTKDLEITKALSFVTMYIESFSNNQFNSFNNNFAGVKLNYSWPGEIPKLFTTNYICMRNNDGYSYPYAEFTNVDNLYKLLQAKWGPLSSTYILTPDSLAEGWIRHWNRQTMSLPNFENYKVTQKTSYDNVVYKIDEALKMAKTLGLIG